MTSLDTLRNRHRPEDVHVGCGHQPETGGCPTDCPQQTYERICAGCGEQWPCDTKQALDHADRLAADLKISEVAHRRCMAERQATIDAAHRQLNAYRAGHDQILADIRTIRRRIQNTELVCAGCVDSVQEALNNLGPLIGEECAVQGCDEPRVDWGICAKHLAANLPDEASTPELPPEPAPGTLATVEWRTDDGIPVREVWERRNGPWWQLDADYRRIGLDWDDLHHRGKVTVLVPDPAAAQRKDRETRIVNKT